MENYSAFDTQNNYILKNITLSSNKTLYIVYSSVCKES